MNIRIVRCRGAAGNAAVRRFLSRPAFDKKAEAVARRVLQAIRTRGDRAVCEYARRFDGVSVRMSNLRVTPKEIAHAKRQVDSTFLRVIRAADRRIAAFSRAGRKRDWRMPSSGGGWVGERLTALDRVGVYVPGGEAPLVSTVLMSVTLARVAGVREIVACTPSDRQGKVNPFVLCAMDVAGATEVYRVGGIQAIGLMAFGTESVSKVQKIVGPGGVFVTAAKRQVYGEVALDLVAGPSEIAVLADDSADPRYVAADLLSQAEHGTGWEKALLVTTSEALAKRVRAECHRQVRCLSRAEAVRRVAQREGLLLTIVDSLVDGMELCNKFAPEHLELMLRNPARWLTKVRRVGAVFLGAWSPESTGDFAAGPSHILPTGGAAAMFSGLTVDDFRRRTSVIAFTRNDLEKALPIITCFSRVEGLDAHLRSATIRFGED